MIPVSAGFTGKSFPVGQNFAPNLEIKRADNVISVLVYPFRPLLTEGTKELWHEGSYRNICNQSFDCFFYQRPNFPSITRLNFSAIDAIVTANEGMASFADDIRSMSNNFLNLQRDSSQIWVAWSVESALNDRSWKPYEKVPKLNSLFNWTVFPSQFATVHRKYFHIEKRSTNSKHVEISVEDIRNRSKNYCWIISNCDSTWNNRNSMGNELIQHLKGPIHFWGAALQTKKCLHKSNNTIDHGTLPGLWVDYFDNSQRQMLDCKFYLAFENSNCSDYVTEKFLNAIEAGAIPIVNGWPKTYEQLLPGSFIHANQFGSIPKLAGYLDSLLKNEAELMKYHYWRSKFAFKRPSSYESACELCSKLQNVRTGGKEKNVVKIIPNLAFHVKKLQKCGP